ncbi:MAG: hypothetical protein ACKVS9_09700 [Phycisphaerae bacterium]
MVRIIDLVGDSIPTQDVLDALSSDDETYIRREGRIVGRLDIATESDADADRLADEWAATSSQNGRREQGIREHQSGKSVSIDDVRREFGV